MRGRCAGSRPRPARRRAVFFRRCSGERFSASASLSASEASTSSKANRSWSSGSRSERGPTACAAACAAGAAAARSAPPARPARPRCCRARLPMRPTLPQRHHARPRLPGAAPAAPRDPPEGLASVRRCCASAWNLRRCGRCGNPSRALHTRMIEPGKQCGELHGRQPHSAVGDWRPAQRATLQLTWDVLLSSVRSGSHGMISDGGVRTVSRFEPVCVLAFPSQDKLTFGRRTRQPNHHPACGG